MSKNKSSHIVPWDISSSIYNLFFSLPTSTITLTNKYLEILTTNQLNLELNCRIVDKLGIFKANKEAFKIHILFMVKYYHALDIQYLQTYNYIYNFIDKK